MEFFNLNPAKSIIMYLFQRLKYNAEKGEFAHIIATTVLIIKMIPPDASNSRNFWIELKILLREDFVFFIIFSF
jgi:hypothetical protein